VTSNGLFGCIDGCLNKLVTAKFNFVDIAQNVDGAWIESLLVGAVIGEECSPFQSLSLTDINYLNAFNVFWIYFNVFEDF